MQGKSIKSLLYGIVYKGLPALLPVLLLAGCSQAYVAPIGFTGSASEGVEKRAIENVSYEIPAGWTTIGDGLGGYMHEPPDGGILYVSKVQYSMADFTDTEQAAEVVTVERDRMMGSIENAELIEETAEVWKNANSLKFWFYGDVDGERTMFYARLFPYDDFLYSFLFGFPRTEECELRLNHAAIEESIFIPIQLREESGPPAASEA